MILEILTGAFAAATMGYLWARNRHNNRVDPVKDKWQGMVNADRVPSTERVTISKEARLMQEGKPFPWQTRGTDYPTDANRMQNRLLENKSEMERDTHLTALKKYDKF